MNLLKVGRTVMIYSNARAGTSKRLMGKGWFPIEVDGKPFVLAPSREGVLDLLSLLRDHGYKVEITAGKYLTTANPDVVTEEAVRALEEHWGSGLLVVTLDTFATFESMVEKLPCRGTTGVPPWIRLRWKDGRGFVAQCSHQKMKKCRRCPARNGKLVPIKPG